MGLKVQRCLGAPEDFKLGWGGNATANPLVRLSLSLSRKRVGQNNTNSGAQGESAPNKARANPRKFQNLDLKFRFCRFASTPLFLHQKVDDLANTLSQSFNLGTLTLAASASIYIEQFFLKPAKASAIAGMNEGTVAARTVH